MTAQLASLIFLHLLARLKRKIKKYKNTWTLTPSLLLVIPQIPRGLLFHFGALEFEFDVYSQLFFAINHTCSPYTRQRVIHHDGRTPNGVKRVRCQQDIKHVLYSESTARRMSLFHSDTIHRNVMNQEQV